MSPAASTAKRPRLKAIASSVASRAGRVVSRPPGTVCAVSVRVPDMVVIVIGTAPLVALAARSSDRVCVRLSHVMTNRPAPKLAVEVDALEVHCQVPALIGASRQFSTAGGGGTGLGFAAGEGLLTGGGAGGCSAQAESASRTARSANALAGRCPTL